MTNLICMYHNCETKAKYHVKGKNINTKYCSFHAGSLLKELGGEIELKRLDQNSVLQDWVLKLGLRHQGVLLTAVRGCDIVEKNDASKLLCRCLRNEFLNCHNGDPSKAVSFIEEVSNEELLKRMYAVLKNCDHYPHHYLMHIMHAVEIIGYKKPDSRWLGFYLKLCHGLHVNPETEEQLDKRLNADEETFAINSKIE